MARQRHHRRARLAALAAATLIVGLSTAGVAAHKHVVNQGTDQETELANGQNHPAFDSTFTSCESGTLLAGFGPAWYGLETAHHGPDSGEAGKGDGCYQADASPSGEDDDVNPAID